MIQIRKHDKGELYSIYGFFIDPNKDVWVDKKQLMELYNEIKKLIGREITWNDEPVELKEE